MHTPKGINEPICEFCGYDPPFKLVGRRNEVWLHLDMTEDEVGSSVEADVHMLYVYSSYVYVDVCIYI